MIVLVGSRHAEAQDHIADEWRIGELSSRTSEVLAHAEHDFIDAGREVGAVDQGAIAAAVDVGGSCGDPPPLAVDPINRDADTGGRLALRRIQHVCRQLPHRSSSKRATILPSPEHIVNTFVVLVNITAPPRPRTAGSASAERNGLRVRDSRRPWSFDSGGDRTYACF